MFLLKHSPFFAPEEVIDKGKEELGKEDIIELLGEDDEKDEKLDIKEKKEEKEPEKEDEEKEEKEEKDELDEELEELEEPDEDKLELTTPVRRKEILSKYPKLFKDFPYLEKAYYREQQFTEILSTIDDAKLAVSKAEVLDKFESDLGKGNLEPALKAVKNNEAAFASLVDNYLPTLAKVDRDAYHHVVGNIIKTTTLAMIKEGESSKNEELQEAAKILNHFVFGNTQVTPPTNLAKPKEDTSKDDELARREREILQRQFEDSRDGLNTKVGNVLKSTIEANIDPKESMTDYVRRNATRECQEKLEELLDGDKRLGILIDKLWESAFKDGFSRSSLDKIKSAYLSRARTLLPTVIKQARNEALKGLGKRVVDDEDDTPKKGPLPAGRSASSNKSSGKSEREQAKAIPKDVSTRDYLMQD